MADPETAECVAARFRPRSFSSISRGHKASSSPSTLTGTSAASSIHHALHYAAAADMSTLAARVCAGSASSHPNLCYHRRQQVCTEARPSHGDIRSPSLSQSRRPQLRHVQAQATNPGSSTSPRPNQRPPLQGPTSTQAHIPPERTGHWRQE